MQPVNLVALFSFSYLFTELVSLLSRNRSTSVCVYSCDGVCVSFLFSNYWMIKSHGLVALFTFYHLFTGLVRLLCV